MRLLSAIQGSRKDTTVSLALTMKLDTPRGLGVSKARGLNRSTVKETHMGFRAEILRRPLCEAELRLSDSREHQSLCDLSSRLEITATAPLPMSTLASLRNGELKADVQREHHLRPLERPSLPRGPSTMTSGNIRHGSFQPTCALGLRFKSEEHLTEIDDDIFFRDCGQRPPVVIR
ncbi:hypothetical protein ACRRTK_008642 [Alexandromys fortis]